MHSLSACSSPHGTFSQRGGGKSWGVGRRRRGEEEGFKMPARGGGGTRSLGMQVTECGLKTSPFKESYSECHCGLVFLFSFAFLKLDNTWFCTCLIDKTCDFQVIRLLSFLKLMLITVISQ